MNHGTGLDDLAVPQDSLLKLIVQAKALQRVCDPFKLVSVRVHVPQLFLKDLGKLAYDDSSNHAADQDNGQGKEQLLVVGGNDVVCR